MLFDGWEGMVRVALTGIAAYLAIVVLLRVSGKRTLSKMNAFDFIVTIALGSALSATILDENISLAEGVTAMAVLIGAQYVITSISYRSTGFRDLMKAHPRMVYYQGAFLKDAMRRERVTESEVRAAIRAEGGATLEDVAAVVLETDGSFTVVKELGGGGERSILENVKGA